MKSGNAFSGKSCVDLDAGWSILLVSGSQWGTRQAAGTAAGRFTVVYTSHYIRLH
jgi:hypothetical protein